MTTPHLSTFAGFTQMAYVTTDIDQALAQFGQSHGVTQWFQLRDLKIEVQPREHAQLHIALAFVGPTQIELIQPVGGADAVYRTPLPEQGYATRFHHFAQLIDTEEAFDRHCRELKALGHRVVIEGLSAGSMRYFYVDFRETLGHYIEVSWYMPAGLAFMAQIPRN